MDIDFIYTMSASGQKISGKKLREKERRERMRERQSQRLAIPSWPTSAQQGGGAAAAVLEETDGMLSLALNGLAFLDGGSTRPNPRGDEGDDASSQQHQQPQGMGAYVLEPLDAGAAEWIGAGAPHRHVVDPTSTPQLGEEKSGNPAASPAAAEEGDRRLAEDEEDDERVVLPSNVPLAEAAGRRHRGRSRKETNLSWEALKVSVVRSLGPSALSVVEQHDGNARDPLFTVRMKMHYNSVPVPSHWSRLRPFLSQQADREPSAVVPLEVQSLQVGALRASKGKAATITPNQIAFMSCFWTGTSLQRRRFGLLPANENDVQVPLLYSQIGDVFCEGRWVPSQATRCVPGKLSSRLREALSMGATTPPPWLYAMQEMGCLPPAYPRLAVQGISAPIPAGAQWGHGVGQWGAPPRAADDRSFLFPGVMDETALRGNRTVGSGGIPMLAPGHWGMVPPLIPITATAPSSPPAPAARAPPAAAAAPPPAPAGPKQPTVAPQVFIPPTAASGLPIPPSAIHNLGGPREREYIQVPTGAYTGGIAAGHNLVLREGGSGMQPAMQPPRPPPGTNLPIPPSAARGGAGGSSYHKY